MGRGMTRTLAGAAVVIALTGAPATADPLSITIDIQPQMCPNVISVPVGEINLGPRSAGIPGRASVPVAILGSSSSPAIGIDLTSIRLEGIAPLSTRIADVSGPPATAETECECPAGRGDGYPDLVALFDGDALAAAFAPSDGQEPLRLTLTCTLGRGIAASGSDCVRFRTYVPGPGGTPAAPVTKDAASTRNFPNPFNAATVIGYTLTESGPVRLDVFDVLGRNVVTLVNEFQSAGPHEVRWDATGAASGMYFYRLTATGASETRTMVLLR